MIAPQCFIYDVSFKTFYLYQKLRLLRFGYCTWPYCNFDNISINCAALNVSPSVFCCLDCFILACNLKYQFHLIISPSKEISGLFILCLLCSVFCTYPTNHRVDNLLPVYAPVYMWHEFPGVSIWMEINSKMVLKGLCVQWLFLKHRLKTKTRVSVDVASVNWPKALF